MRFFSVKFTLLCCLLAGNSFAAFPEKPIQLVVYTKPGGAIDTFARMFQSIAKNHTDTTFVIINKPGAGGIIAMEHILNHQADGYTLGVVTKSNIGKMVSSQNRSISLDSFHWMAMLVSDPEALITNRLAPINTWEKVLADAKVKNGKQLWLGPATGGNDHVMAIKTWKKAGIKATWVPYGGGGKAIAALLGKHGVVYVGNPGDVLGKPDLSIIAISSKTRLPEPFADVPTFMELGIEGLDEEIMWRGFITKKGLPPEAANYYHELFAAIQSDPQWQAFITGRGANPVYLEDTPFTQMVRKDKAEFEEVYRTLINTNKNGDSNKSHSTASSRLWLIPVLLLVFGGISAVAYRFRRAYLGQVFIPATMICLSILFIITSSSFPPENAGPAVIPRLYSLLIIIFSALLLVNVYRKKLSADPKNGDIRGLLTAIMTLVGYIVLIPLIGYFISSFIFLITLMYVLSYRRHVVIWSVAIGWTLFSYIIFYNLLYIQLPLGQLYRFFAR